MRHCTGQQTQFLQKSIAFEKKEGKKRKGDLLQFNKTGDITIKCNVWTTSHLTARFTTLLLCVQIISQSYYSTFIKMSQCVTFYTINVCITHRLPISSLCFSRAWLAISGSSNCTQASPVFLLPLQSMTKVMSTIFSPRHQKIITNQCCYQEHFKSLD